MFANCNGCGCEIHLKLIDEAKRPKPEDIYCYNCWKERENKNEIFKSRNQTK